MGSVRRVRRGVLWLGGRRVQSERMGIGLPSGVALVGLGLRDCAMFLGTSSGARVARSRFFATFLALTHLRP